MKNMKKYVLYALSMVLVAALAVTGTVAYLNDTDSDVNTMVMGNVDIEQEETDNEGNDFVQDQPLYPGSEVEKNVKVENTGKSDAYVRTLVAFEKGSLTQDEFNSIITIEAAEGFTYKCDAEIQGTTYAIYEYVYTEAVEPGTTTEPSLKEVHMNTAATNEDCKAIDGNGNGKYDIIVLSQAVQTENFTKGAADALDTAFGAVTKETAADWIGNRNGFVVNNDEELAAAIAAGETEIWLNPGKYNVSNAQRKTLVINGTEESVIEIYNEREDGCDYGFDSATVTFNGVKFDTTTHNDGNYRGFTRLSATFNDCTFFGPYTTHLVQTFNNCTFDTNNGYIWIWGAEEVNFNNTTFTGNTKAILAHGWASSEININNCTFAATEVGTTSSGDVTAAVEIDPAGTNVYTINFTGNNTKTDAYNGWTRIKDGSTGHIITGLN